MDEYNSDYLCFQVSGFDITVKDELLVKALNVLTERKRSIILLSYFLDMSDAAISELLNVIRSTVFRHRKTALVKIKQYLEEKADEEYRTKLCIRTLKDKAGNSYSYIDEEMRGRLKARLIAHTLTFHIG